MKRSLWLLLLVPLLMGARPNSANYSQRYFGTGAGGNTLANSDVIVGATATVANGGSTTVGVPTILKGCLIENTKAAAQWIIFYDSATVPGDGANPGPEMAWVKCAASSTCSWGDGAVNRSENGGAGVAFVNGIAWSNSSTFPAKTIGASDTKVACSYDQ